MKPFFLFHCPLLSNCLTIVFFILVHRIHMSYSLSINPKSTKLSSWQRLQHLISQPEMDPNITHDFPPLFRVYSDGHVERYFPWNYISPSFDPQTRVLSKDVVISPENNVSARIYLPETAIAKPDTKGPLIVYVHGGGFCIQSAFSSLYHYYLNTLSSRTGSVIVSVEYRLAPEHPLPACYDDSWDVIKWVESHSQVRQGSDPWLNEYVDFGWVYLVGDSAGANIAHNMAIRAGSTYYTGDQFGLKIAGLVLVHPFFGISSESEELWDYICPDTTGSRDFRLNPGADMDMWLNMRCERALVCVAEKDSLRECGWNYYEKLKKSDWKGEIDLFESPGENHIFHLLKPSCENAVSLMDRITGFLQNKAVC